ncbi:hypothetical protein LNK20_16730 [Bacillus safensis]|uniref:hypothetical protein n=1 Tax=Bacillus safensis TaxID=561879 RepID=UPI001FFB5FC9|nr:hypothetical protein [Bacillus safensis]MCK1974342.1 hypothetical protein [Bacillus safensis]
MLHFIKLELRKSHMKNYIQASMIASIVLLVFIYFAAFAARDEQEIGFQQYPNIQYSMDDLFFDRHIMDVLSSSGEYIERL